MIKWFSLIAITIILNACSTTRLINPNKPAELSLISATQQQKAEITRVGGRRFVVSQLQVKPDSARGFDGKQSIAIATSDVKTITQIRRGRGALQGLGIGLGIGMVIGGVIANALYEEPENPCEKLDDVNEFFYCYPVGAGLHEIGNEMDKVGEIMQGMALGALGVGIVGTLIGNEAGSRSNYMFVKGESNPSGSSSGGN